MMYPCGRAVRALRAMYSLSLSLSACRRTLKQVRDLPSRDLQGPRDRGQPQLRFRGV